MGLVSVGLSDGTERNGTVLLPLGAETLPLLAMSLKLEMRHLIL